MLPIYLALELVFLALFSLNHLASNHPNAPMPCIFCFSICTGLISCSLYGPILILCCSCFIPLCYQTALVFKGRMREMWAGAMILAIGVGMTVTHGIAGFAEGLLPMAGCLIFFAYVTVYQEITLAARQSQAMLAALHATHQKLETYAGQVDRELTAIEEHNRLARELHDSVSQTLFSIILNTRSAQILLERDPSRIRAQLENLQSATQTCLIDMRKFISSLKTIPGRSHPL